MGSSCSRALSGCGTQRAVDNLPGQANGDAGAAVRGGLELKSSAEQPGSLLHACKAPVVLLSRRGLRIEADAIVLDYQDDFLFGIREGDLYPAWLRVIHGV